MTLSTADRLALADLVHLYAAAVDDRQFDEWMRGSPDQAVTLLTPYPGMIEAREVGADVGNVKNNRPQLME